MAYKFNSSLTVTFVSVFFLPFEPIYMNTVYNFHFQFVRIIYTLKMFNFSFCYDTYSSNFLNEVSVPLGLPVIYTFVFGSEWSSVLLRLFNFTLW